MEGDACISNSTIKLIRYRSVKKEIKKKPNKKNIFDILDIKINISFSVSLTSKKEEIFSENICILTLVTTSKVYCNK